jgi:alpha-1,6-mannosyltransferase
MSVSGARRHLVIVVASFAAASLVSWARVVATGTVRIDQPTYSTWLVHVPMLVFGLFMLAAARSVVALFDRPEISWRALVGGAVGAHVVAATSAPLTSNDLFSNVAYAHMIARGLDPYAHGPAALGADDPFASLVGARWRETPMVYGPAWAWIESIVGRAQSILGVAIALKIVMLGATLAGVVIAWRLACVDVDEARGKSRFVLFALSPTLIWEASSQAHNDGVMVLGVVAFVAFVRAGRSGSAANALTLGVMTKLAAAPLLVFWIVTIARKSKLRALGFAALATLVVAAVGARWWHDASTLRASASTLGGDGTRTARSFVDLFCLAATPLGPVAKLVVYRAGWLAGGAAVIAIATRGVLLARTVDDAIHRTLLVTLAYCVVGTPWFQPWYATWILPLAMVDGDPRWRRLTMIYCAITPIQYLVALDPLTTVAIDLYVLSEVRRIVVADRVAI